MKFSDFIAHSSQRAEAPEGIQIDGAFGCQTCYEQVDEAEYFPVEKILKWKCSESHISYIEEFIL